MCKYVQAQPPNFSITRLTPDDGLSQGSNYFKYEDSKGFMWLTSNDAINRYDGKMVKVYNLDKYFINCPNLQQGYGFAEDDKSNIYIGSVRGLYIYHRDKNQFTLQKMAGNDAEQDAMPFAFRDGLVWCFNKKFELTTYHVHTKKISFITRLKLIPLVSLHVYQLNENTFYYHYPFIDKRGNVWVIGNENVACYDIRTKKQTYPLSEITNQQKLVFYSSTYDPYMDRIIFGTNKGLISYNRETKQTRLIKALKGLDLSYINGMSCNKDFIVLRTETAVVLLTKDYKVVKWLIAPRKNGNRVFGFSFDKSNRIWVCDDGLGQMIFDFKPKLLNKEPDENSPVDYFEGMGVSTIAELPDGNILMQGKYVQNRLDHVVTVFEDFKFSKELKRTTTDKFRKGVWFFSQNIKHDRSVSKISFYSQNHVLKDMLTDQHIKNLGVQQDLEVLSDGRIICSFEKGLYWLNLKTKTLDPVKGLPQSNPFKINVLSKKRIAVSYLNGSMLLADAGDHNLKLVKEILPGIQSFYLQEDTLRQRYWAGTNEGVYLLDKNFKLLKKFNANNGLSGTYIYGLLLDNEGNAWCAHQRGLSSINTHTFQIINFDKNDGIQDYDFNNRSFYKKSDGTLYFGGVKGFNYFKPPIKPYSFYKPEVYVDEILVNNKPYAANLNANNIHQMELDYFQNNISIKAIVKDLANANVRKIIYRIKETDNKWKSLPNNSLIIFNNLAPNNYTLQLGTYDKYTNKEIFQKTLLIYIKTPFFKTKWFWALIAILVTALVFYVFNQRKLIKQKNVFHQQLALVQQRNKITADLHDDIGASLSSLQLNSAVANQLIHKDLKKVQEILSKIEDQSKNLADKIGDIIWSMKPGKDEFMTMSSRIKNFANDILSATSINYKIQIMPEADTLIQDITVRKNIVLITKEATNNIVKYSKADKVNINLRIEHGKILLVITDNGVGFEANELIGNGLQNMRKRTEELDGTFHLVSALKVGTTITITIPLVP